jgi:hypothetical protein
MDIHLKNERRALAFYYFILLLIIGFFLFITLEWYGFRHKLGD